MERTADSIAEPIAVSSEDGSRFHSPISNVWVSKAASLASRSKNHVRTSMLSFTISFFVDSMADRSVALRYSHRVFPFGLSATFILSDESANTSTDVGCWSRLVETKLGFIRQKRSNKNALVRNRISVSRRPRDRRLLSGAKINKRQAKATINKLIPSHVPVGSK